MEYLIGFACGATVFAWVGWRVHSACLRRIFENKEKELISHRLQTRRDAIDYNIDQETPDGAGPAGGVDSLFEMHPGAMTLSHIAKSKVSEKVDPQ